jgi:hypothetical protein
MDEDTDRKFLRILNFIIFYFLIFFLKNVYCDVDSSNQHSVSVLWVNRRLFMVFMAHIVFQIILTDSYINSFIACSLNNLSTKSRNHIKHVSHVRCEPIFYVGLSFNYISKRQCMRDTGSDECQILLLLY